MSRLGITIGALRACLLTAALCLTYPDSARAEQLPTEPSPDAAGQVVAQPATGTSEQAFRQQGVDQSVFEGLWADRQTALQRGDVRGERAVLQLLLGHKQNSGWPNLFDYGVVLARQSLDAVESGDLEVAMARARASIGLAPDHPLTHAAYAQVAWSAGLPKMTSLEHYLEALWLCVAEPVQARRIGGEVLVACWFSILAASILFSIVTMFRHLGTVVDDIERVLPHGSTLQQRWLLVVSIALTPPLLGLGSVVSIVVWLTLTGFHMARSERLASVTVLVWLTLLPLALPTVLSHLAYPGSPSEHLYLAARDQQAPVRALDIHSLASADPAHAKLVRGARAYWGGDLEKAHALLEEAARYEQAGPEIFTALGNSRFRLGKRTGAIDAYSEAERIDPKHVAAVYNASRVYYNLADHENAVGAHQRAAALDFGQIALYEAEAEQKGNWYVADERIPNKILFAKAWEKEAPAAIANAFWETFFVYGRRDSALTALTGLILAFIIALIRHGIERSKPTLGQRRYHDQLRKALTGDPAEDRSVQIRRQIAVHRRQARLMRLQRAIGLLIAGGGHLVKGASLSGLILACLFGASLILFLNSAGFIPALVPLDVSVSQLLALPYGVLVVLWYLLAIIIKPREDW